MSKSVTKDFINYTKEVVEKEQNSVDKSLKAMVQLEERKKLLNGMQTQVANNVHNEDLKTFINKKLADELEGINKKVLKQDELKKKKTLLESLSRQIEKK